MHLVPHSYDPADVTFLLRPLAAAEAPVVATTEEKERLIRTGARHYSEMIGPEDKPARLRLRLFSRCLAANAPRFARDIALLASALAASVPDPDRPDLTLVSLARAGTPVGVLLQRRLRSLPGWGAAAVRHYSVSVLRDRGLDLAALAHIVSLHPPATLRFLDGWTGKGVIAREVAATLAALPADSPLASVPPGLWTPLDICAAAAWASGTDDYLPPAALLGATISGLVSRSILHRDDISAGLLHQAVPLIHLRRYDLSRWFVRHIESHLPPQENNPPHPSDPLPPALRALRRQAVLDWLAHAAREFSLPDPNRIKPGIGETTRAALRRVPRLILLRDTHTPDSQLLRDLAALRHIPVAHRPDLPFAAAAIIGDKDEG